MSACELRPTNHIHIYNHNHNHKLKPNVFHREKLTAAAAAVVVSVPCGRFALRARGFPTRDDDVRSELTD